jgi:hypothetical protein
MTRLISRWLAPTLICAGMSCNSFAVDGIILIDQNRALAGGVTPGDAPGFPVTISVPGSYRLSGDLTVPNADTTAIRVTADNVNIDLNGFSIIGPVVCTGIPVTSCSPTGTGIGVNADLQRDITVVNGSVRGMGSYGIVLTGDGGYVEKVHVRWTGGSGIVVVNGTVIGNTAYSNFNNGLDITAGTVTGNIARYNHGSGIDSGGLTLISGNTALDNAVYGISTNCPANVVGNTAVGNNVLNLHLSAPGCGNFNNVAP